MQALVTRPQRLLRCNVKCESNRTDRIREVRKQLLEVRKNYEDKRFAGFKALVSSVQAFAENEQDFIKEIATKIIPQCDVVKEQVGEKEPVDESTKNVEKSIN